MSLVTNLVNTIHMLTQRSETKFENQLEMKIMTTINIKKSISQEENENEYWS